MNIEEIVNKYKYEIKLLHKFRAYTEVLKVNAGLSDEAIKELNTKINIRISQCEISIREFLSTSK